MLHLRRTTERGHANHGWLDTSTPSRSPTTTIRRTWASAPCASSTRTACAGAGLRHAPAPGHGDHHLRAGGGHGAQGQHGPRGVIRPGEVQRMTAGTGVLHSEFNPSRDRAGALLPDLDRCRERGGHTPSYEQKAFDAAERRNGCSSSPRRTGATAR